MRSSVTSSGTKIVIVGANGTMLFATDVPFREGAEEIGGLSAFQFRPEDLRAIERDNALKLLPTLKA